MLRARRCISKRWLGVFTVLLVSLASDSRAYTAKVTTRFGRVHGFLRNSDYGRQRLVAHYFGIPYAEPPVGDLRFRNPKPWCKYFTRAFAAMKVMPVCVQLDDNMNVVGQEDCLYLNINVPVISEKHGESCALLPVLVYVHSGWTRTDYRHLPTDYMMDQDVILVVVQYRLNIFGFFGTGTEASPGNYGLKDIVMALRWIQGNIGSFGGDPNSVTLWGHGEAASLVHMLALTKKTEGLFHRYIIQSATALCPMAVNSRTRTRKIALATARSFDCLPRNDEKNVTTTRTNVTNEEEEEGEQEELDEEHEKAMMHCLREVKDIERFRKVMNYPKQKDWRSNRCCVFAPTIEKESDDAIVTVHPLTIMEHRLFRDIPFIMGVVHDEGLYKSIAILTNVTAKLLNNFETNLHHVLQYSQLISNVTGFTRAIGDFYFGGNVFTGSLDRNITEMIGDALVFWPAYQTLKYQSDRMNSSTYFYLFSYEGTFTSTFDSGIPKHFGVSHGDDLNYLLPILNKKYHDYMLHNTENDVTMINIMTEMWAGFATKGVPEAWKVTPWPDYKKSHRFLRLGAGKLSDIAEESELFPKRMAFWEELTANLTLNPIDFDFPQYIEDDESNSSVPKQRSEMFICLTMLLAICFL
ncbi:esterase FE4-like isoform X2 [Frieseomelitta varia]|uniref:esterase FE4-like isoform X2 n=1 Tax=Frieseomelitta varia TaxID=561572 RepID=UPI001CB6913A|nr:esterase FE4-like isoform X2 [Frieseomelitta varia]